MSGSDAEVEVFRFGEFTLDAARGTLTRNDETVRLRPKSLAVLHLLLQRAGQLVSKDEFMQAVWSGTVVTDGSLTQCIIDIRRALDDHDLKIVRTVPRRGFIFDAPVARVEAGPDRVPSPPAESGPENSRQPKPRESPSLDRRVVAWSLIALGVLGAMWWWTSSQNAGPVATDAGSPVAPPPDPESIAVLRFADLSPDQDQAYFADGLAEEILNLLAGSRLHVTARTSSFAINAGDADIPAIARQLNVAYLLEGSVRRDQDRVRVTVQLVDAATSTQVWSHSYQSQFSSFLDLQQEIATDIAAKLNVSLPPSPLHSDPDRARAQDLFLLGQFLYHRRGPGDLEAALDKYQQALDLDPGHARAWVGVAGAYNALSLDGRVDGDEALRKQGQALQKALEIDAELAVAHARMARYLYLMGDLEGSSGSIRRAAELNPAEDLVLEIQANLAMLEGRADDAVTAIQRIVSRDPLSAIRRNHLANFLLSTGRAQEAIVQFRRAAQLSPEQNYHWGIARALVIQGDDAAALAEAASIEHDPWRDQIEAMVADDIDSSPAAIRLSSDPDLMDRLLLAEIHAHRGEHDVAFNWLSPAARAVAAAARGGPESRLRLQLVASPFLRTLHADPRWSDVMDTLLK